MTARRRVLLLAPPVVQPVAPFLALPSLTAYLRALGHHVVQRDVNAELFRWVRTPDGAAAFAAEALARGLVAPENAVLFKARLSMMPALFERMRGKELYAQPGRVFEEAFENYCNLGLPVPAGEEQAEAHKRFWEALFDRFAAGLGEWTGFDVVGVSVFADTQAVPGQALARWARRRCGARWILAGGGLFSETAQDSGTAERWRDFDGVVFYEGEKVLETLLEDLNAPEKVENLLWFDKEGRMRPPRMRSLDLSMAALPTPCYDGLPLDQYCLQQLVLPVCATRACYWNKCTFCTLSERTSGGVFRMRDAKAVVADVRRLRDETGAKIFRFIDDSIPPHLMRDMLDGFIQADLGVEWGCHLNVDRRYLRPDFIAKLRPAGCRLISFGLESANKRVRRLIEKDPANLDGVATLEELLPALQAAGLKTGLSVIVGLPTETEAEARETIAWLEARRGLINFMAINIFVLQASSTAYKEPEKNMLAVDHSHPRGFRPTGGMTHDRAEAVWQDLRDLGASWAAKDPSFSADSAVLPQSILRVVLQDAARNLEISA